MTQRMHRGPACRGLKRKSEPVVEPEALDLGVPDVCRIDGGLYGYGDATGRESQCE